MHLPDTPLSHVSATWGNGALCRLRTPPSPRADPPAPQEVVPEGWLTPAESAAGDVQSAIETTVTVPFDPSTTTRSPSRSRRLPSEVLTTAGKPSSRATIAP